jgi:hypothetical protein
VAPLTVMGVRHAVPAAWETADSYLVTAEFDGALALVRCRVSSGSCQRAVRSHERPEPVASIVTERSWLDAVPLN